MRSFRVGLVVVVLAMMTYGVIRAAAAEEKTKSAPDPDFAKFPQLKGKVVHVLGHLGSYVPPKGGETLDLNFKDIRTITQLPFDAARKSYIPVIGKLTVQAHYYSNDAFASMRLLWTTGRNKVTVDVAPASGTGNPQRVFVWVIVESDVTNGVALIDCEYDGEFPRRPR